ncbi:MAG TPA: GNAT family N-acetyltransferase [Paludibacter sp.]|nr:GNAT family N-acetyltransferase [Paludibacter sp.]
MKKAKITDKEVVVDILTTSFVHDPHIGFLLEKSRNKNKLRIIMDYVFEESFNKGEIYLNDDNTAVALWNTSTREKISWKYIWRNLSFLFQIGLASTWRILEMDKLVHMCHPHTGRFAHLYTIGVLPESRGKGYARKMIEFMTQKLSNTQTTLYLETANATNIGIYNKLGFHVFHTIRKDGHKLFCMNRIC